MRHPILTALALATAAAALSACSAGDDSGALGKEVGDVRSELARVQKENEKLSGQVAAQTRRIDGLTEDLNHVRQLAMDVKVAPVPKSSGAAADDGGVTLDASGAVVAHPGSAALSTPETAAIKSFLATEEGRKVLEAAVVAERESQRQAQTKRQIDAMMDRFAKTAGLTEDQTKRMKDIMEKQAETLFTSISAMRDLGPDATPEQRDELRTQTTAKREEVRKATDDQVKTVLSQTQYDLYQQEQDKMRANMRGFGAGGGGGGGGARAGRQGN